MATVEVRVEVSDAQVTATAYAFDTQYPWASIDFSPAPGGRGCEVSLQVNNVDDLDRIAEAIDNARAHFESFRAERSLVSELVWDFRSIAEGGQRWVPACETEVIR